MSRILVLVALVTLVVFASVSSVDAVAPDYETATHVTTWSGIWATSQSGDVEVTRIGRSVTLLLPRIVATASISGAIVSDTYLPTQFRPTSTFEVRGYCTCWV